MLATIMIWGYVFLLSFVYGYVILSFFPFQDDSAEAVKTPVSMIVLLGITALSGIGSAISLGLNLGLAANLLILALALVLGCLRRRAIGQFVQGKIHAFRQMNWLTLLAFLTVFVVVLLKSTQPPKNYDSGLYHAQAIRWMETYRAIPGLGNLNDRLVFNSSWLLLNALFSFSFLDLRSFHTLNAFLAVLLTGFALGKFDRLQKGEITLSNTAAIFLPFLMRRIFSLELSSPSTDIPAALITWAIIILSMEKIDQKAEARFDFNFLAIFVLAFFAITIKLSVMPILLLPLYFYLRQSRWASPQSLAIHASIVSFLFLPWMARSLVQSGYLVYPVPQVDIVHPDWQIPKENVIGTVAWVRSWAKVPTPDREAVEKMPLPEWLPIWYHNLEALDRQILLLDGAALALSIALQFYQIRKHGLPSGIRSPALLLYLTTLLGILYWFWQAPAMRFGYAFLAIFPVLGAAPFLLLALRSPAIQRWAVPLILVILLVYQGISVYRLANPAALRSIAVLPADYPEVPEVPHMIGEMKVYTPAQGDQCWYEPFPCLPGIDSETRMRGKAITDGFRIAPR